MPLANETEDDRTVSYPDRSKDSIAAGISDGLDGYLAKGITTASPDYGLGLGVFYEF